MATYNFLDKTGLGLVWAKIKALVPTKTSDLTNDSGYITSSSVPTKVSDLTNDSGYLTLSTLPVYDGSVSTGGGS